jgi:hypothetical protein
VKVGRQVLQTYLAGLRAQPAASPVTLAA